MAVTDGLQKAPLANSAAAGRPGFKQTVQLLAGAQKSSKGAPAYSRFVNRRAGRYLAAVAFRLGLTPNGVTGISAAFSFLGILLIALVRPSLGLGVAVCLCLVIGYAFDSADGQLARLRGGGSPAGEWLDHMVDATKISSLHLAVLIGAYRFFSFGHTAWVLVPIGFTIVAAVMFFGMILNEQLRRNAGSAAPPVVSGSPSVLRSLMVIPTDYGLLCVVFVLLGAPAIFFGAYTLLFLCNAGFMVLAAFKWYGDMRALTPGSSVSNK